MNGFFRLKYFIFYKWRAKTKYYLHSPFVYQFYLNVLEGSTDAALQAIDNIRRQLSSNNQVVEVKDLGAGNASAKKICAIESNVAVRKKYGYLLYRLVKYFKPDNILELGTSIGISSLYLASANPQTTVISIESNSSLVKVAHNNYTALGINNVITHTGNFDNVLPQILQNQPSLGLVFFDGNHKKDATLKYFKLCLEKATAESIFIFDDIYWSTEMNEAWNEIKAHPQITLSLDVFQFGICFFRKEKLSKEEFILRY